MTGSHGNRKRVGLCRPPVRTGILVLGRNKMIVTGACRLHLVGMDSLDFSSSNLTLVQLAG